MAEGARLESVYTLIAYRGFESHSLRNKVKERGLERGTALSLVEEAAFPAFLLFDLGGVACGVRFVGMKRLK